MSFEPRLPRARSPPPIYENPPEYTAAVDLSSSPPMAPLPLTDHSFTPSYSFDPGPAFPSLPTRQESVQNDMPSTDFTFPNTTMMETPGDPSPEGLPSVFPVVPKVKATRAKPFDPAAGADEDDSGDDGAKPKVSFDDGLEEEMERIADKYPPGVCALHPTISCFYNRLNDLHFALDRNKRIVWAAAIAAVAVPQPPLTPAGPPAPPQPQFWPNANGFPYPHPQYGHPAIPAWQGTPRRSRRDRSWERSSPPQQSSSKRVRREQPTDPQSSPAVSGGSIDEFIGRYPILPAGTMACLVENGFELGDDPSTLSAEQWEAADIPFFAAARIIKYYNKYKASLR
ncbi:hypothetical protein B0H13DRAFT_2391466 [Mycena leptocephala]|nr:hypothetical protein B0H13DRAFT_2391466 [Mycena leptocephala]